MDEVVKVIVENVLVPAAVALIKDRLDSLATSVQIAPAAESNDALAFPSAALIGLGQCGTNICMNVAELLRAVEDDISTAQEPRKASALFQGLRELFDKRTARHLFAPVILLADLNVDNKDTMLGDKDPTLAVDGYRRCHFIDLAWLQTGGAGNIPFKGQFLGRLALASDLQAQGATPSRASWLASRAYFVDSLGLRENPSRLVFCTFSTGGGTGSGLSLEIGAAQQAIYKGRLERGQTVDAEAVAQPIEPICTLGIGIMPREEQDGMAQSINTGRCVCAYLSRERAFDRGDAQRIFNALLLISNEVMTWDGDETANVENRRVMERANEYVAQQMFHLLAAQALSKDYEQRRWKILDWGPDAKDTIRLDASDLANALRGPTMVTYAESVPSQLDMDDLFRRCVGFPRYNASTECLEGISIIPHSRAAYSTLLEKSAAQLGKALGELPVFRHTTTIVTILSVPERYEVCERDLRWLKAQVAQMTPRATIRRYALVRGASRHVGLCMVLGEGACLSPEVRSHLNHFLVNCFRLPGVPVSEFAALVSSAIKAPDDGALEHALAGLEQAMHEREDPHPILAGCRSPGVCDLIKAQLGARAAQLGVEGLNVNEVLLSRQDALDALGYINRCYRFSGVINLPAEELD